MNSISVSQVGQRGNFDGTRTENGATLDISTPRRLKSTIELDLGRRSELALEPTIGFGSSHRVAGRDDELMHMIAGGAFERPNGDARLARGRASQHGYGPALWARWALDDTRHDTRRSDQGSANTLGRRRTPPGPAMSHVAIPRPVQLINTARKPKYLEKG
jgi:hypothetical protein